MDEQKDKVIVLSPASSATDDVIVLKPAVARPIPQIESSVHALKIGKVAQTVFPVLFAEGHVTVSDVNWLMSDAAIKYFKTSGNQVLRATTNPDVDSRDAKGIRRFYPKFTLPFEGKRYILTSQWFRNGLDNLLTWLAARGFPRERVCEICGAEPLTLADMDAQSATNDLPTENKGTSVEVEPVVGHGNRSVSGELKVGKVAQKVMPVVFAEGHVTQDDINWLLSEAAAKHFKTAGYKVLKATEDPVADARDAQGLNRYYSKFTLDFGGARYLLTSQWYKNGLANLLAWLEKHGVGEDRVREICGCPRVGVPVVESGALEQELQNVEDAVTVSKRDARHVPGACPLTEKDLEEVLPHGVLIDGVRIRPATTWADCYLSICENVQTLDQNKFDGLPDNPMFRRFFVREAAGKKIQDCYLDRFGSANNIRVKMVGSKPYFYMPTYVVQNLLRYFEIDPSRVCIASAEYRDPTLEPEGLIPEIDDSPVVAESVAVDEPAVADSGEDTVVEVASCAPVGATAGGAEQSDQEPVVAATVEPQPPEPEPQAIVQPISVVRDAVVVYGSLTGTTEGVARQIAEKIGAESVNVSSATAETFAPGLLVLGTSTCGGEIQDDWKNTGLAVLDSLDLHGKKVALFGTGDAVCFDSTFGAGMAVLAKKALERGATLVGCVPVAEYGEKPIGAIVCDAGKTLTCGLLLDLENSPDAVEGRVAAWAAKIIG